MNLVYYSLLILCITPFLFFLLDILFVPVKCRLYTPRVHDIDFVGWNNILESTKIITFDALLIPPINIDEEEILFEWYCEYYEDNSFNKSCSDKMKILSWNEAKLDTSQIENYHASSVSITLNLKVGNINSNMSKIHQLVRKCDILDGSFEINYKTTSVDISILSNHPCSSLVNPYIVIKPSILSISDIIKPNSLHQISIPSKLVFKSFIIYYTLIDQNMNRYTLKIPIAVDKIRLLVDNNEESTFNDITDIIDDKEPSTEVETTTIQPTDVIRTTFLNETDKYLIINISNSLPLDSNITINLTTQSTRYIDEINNIISSNYINLPIFIPRKYFLYKYQYIFNITINNNNSVLTYNPSEPTVNFTIYPSNKKCHDSYIIEIYYNDLYNNNINNNNNINLIIGRIPAPEGKSPQLINTLIYPNNINGSDIIKYEINRNVIEENRDKVTAVIIDVSIMSSDDKEIIPYTISYSKELNLRSRIEFTVYNNNNNNSGGGGGNSEICNNNIIIDGDSSEICNDNDKYDFEWRWSLLNNNNNNSELNDFISTRRNATVLTIPYTLWKYNHTYEIELIFIDFTNNITYSNEINITTPNYYSPNIIFPQPTYVFVNNKLLLEPIIIIKPSCLVNNVTYKWKIEPELESNNITLNESSLLIPSTSYFNNNNNNCYFISLKVCLFNNDICSVKSIMAMSNYNDVIMIKLISGNYHASSIIYLDASKTTNKLNKEMIFNWKLNNNNITTTTTNNNNNFVFPNTSVVEIPPYTFNTDTNISITLTVSIIGDNNLLISESKTVSIFIYNEEIPEIKIPSITKKGYDKIDPNSDLEIKTVVTKFTDFLFYKWKLIYTNSPLDPIMKNGDSNKSLILTGLLANYTYTYEVNVSRFNCSSIKSISFTTNIPPIAVLSCNNNNNNNNITCKVGYSNLLCQIKLLSNIIESKILYGLSYCKSYYQIHLPLVKNNEWKLELIVNDGISRSVDYYYINNNNNISTTSDLKKEFLENPNSVMEYSNPIQALSSFNYYSDFVLDISGNGINNDNDDNSNLYPENDGNGEYYEDDDIEDDGDEEIILKSCPGKIIINKIKYPCNNHGKCYSTSNNCSLYDRNCFSYCECDDGYTGQTCKFTIEESNNITIIIKQLNSTITDNLDQLVQSSQAVLSSTYFTMMKYINEISPIIITDNNNNNYTSNNDNIILSILNGSKEIVNNFNTEDKDAISTPLFSTFRDIINRIETHERLRQLKEQQEYNDENSANLKDEIMKIIKSIGCKISDTLTYNDIYNMNITGLSYATTILTTDNDDSREINNNEYIKMKIPLAKDHYYDTNSNNNNLNAQITEWKYNYIYHSSFINNYNYIDGSIYSLNLLNNDKCEDIKYIKQNSNDFIDFTIPIHISLSNFTSFPLCFYYDKETNEMKYDGIITTGYEMINNNLYLLHCSSTHLTDFTGVMMGFLPEIRDINPVLDFPTIFEYESFNLLVPATVAVLIILFFILRYFAIKRQRKIQAALTEYRIKKFVLTGNLTRNEYKTMPSFKRVYIDTLSNYHSYIAVFNSSFESMLTIGRTQRLIILFANIFTDLAYRSSYFGHNPNTISQYIGVMILANLITIPILYILPYGFEYANQLKQPSMKRIKASDKTKQYYEKTKQEIEIITDKSKENKRQKNDRIIARNQLSNYELLLDKNKWRYWCSGLYVTISLLCIVFGICMFFVLEFSGLGITMFVISLLLCIIAGVGCIFCLSDNKFLEFCSLVLSVLYFVGSVAFSIIWLLLAFEPSATEPIYKMIDNGMFNFLIPGIEKMFRCSNANECSIQLADYMKEWVFMSSFLVITAVLSIFSIYHSIRLFLSPKRSKLIIPMRAIIKSYTPRDYQYIRMIQERMKFLIRKWRHERADVFREWNNGSTERQRMLYSLYIICGLWSFICCYLIILYGPNYTKSESIDWTLHALQSMALSCIISQPIVCFLKAVLSYVVQYSYFS